MYRNVDENLRGILVYRVVDENVRYALQLALTNSITGGALFLPSLASPATTALALIPMATTTPVHAKTRKRCTVSEHSTSVSKDLMRS